MSHAVKYLLLFPPLLAENWILKNKELLNIPNILMISVCKKVTGLYDAFFMWQSYPTILACVQPQDFTRIVWFIYSFFMHSQVLTEA